MGTDVFYAVEKRSDGGVWEWVGLPPGVEYWREYRAFCAMGNDILRRSIRLADGEPPEPVIPPRGWPSDVSIEANRCFDPEGYLWACNYFTLRELEEFQDKFPPCELIGVVLPYMRDLGSEDEVRVLIGFD